MAKTTIIIEAKTRKLLKNIGRKDQTYDQLLNEMIAAKISTGPVTGNTPS